MNEEVHLCLSGDPGASVDNPPAILRVLASLLERHVSANSQHVQWRQSNVTIDNSSTAYQHLTEMATGPLTVFHGLRAPNISVSQYLERIHRYARCSPACFTLAYIYISRLSQRQPDLLITSLSCHRLVITSILVATKWLDDAYYNNAYYGQIGGVTTKELNRMELEFLLRINFDLNVTIDTLAMVEGQLAYQLGGLTPAKTIANNSDNTSASGKSRSGVLYGSVRQNCHGVITYAESGENEDREGACRARGAPVSDHGREFAPLTPERTYMTYSC